MTDEIRIDAQGLPSEEYRKLPYLLKWVMVKDVGAFRMVEASEPVDVLLVDKEEADNTDRPTTAVSAREIPVARDFSHLSESKIGLTYPLRVVDLQRCLQHAVGAPSESHGPPAAAGEVPEQRKRGGSGNPGPGPAASNVDRLVAPLLEPQPGSDLSLVGGEGVEVVVSPEQGFHSPLGPREFARVGADLSQAKWSPVGKASAENGGDWKPLTRLIWLLAYYGARDGLLPRIPRDRTFTLAGWPDYQVIPMEANNLKVWAYLKWNAADADTIAEATGVDRGQVLGSLNAGYLCGQVRLSEAAEGGAPNTAERPANAGLLGMIRKRLGLQSTNPEGNVT